MISSVGATYICPPLHGSAIGNVYAITRPDGRAYVLTTRDAGFLPPMERRIPIRRQVHDAPHTLTHDGHGGSESASP